MAESKLTVRAGIEHVWQQITDAWMYTGWVVGSSHIRGVDPDWPEVGSKIYHEVGGWPLTLKDYSQIVELDEPRHIALQARGWPLFGEARVELDLSVVEPDRTLLRMFEQPVKGPGKWLDNPLAEYVLTKRVHECLQRLKTIAENRH